MKVQITKPYLGLGLVVGSVRECTRVTDPDSYYKDNGVILPNGVILLLGTECEEVRNLSTTEVPNDGRRVRVVKNSYWAGDYNVVKTYADGAVVVRVKGGAEAAFVPADFEYIDPVAEKEETLKIGDKVKLDKLPGDTVVITDFAWGDVLVIADPVKAGWPEEYADVVRGKKVRFVRRTALGDAISCTALSDLPMFEKGDSITLEPAGLIKDIAPVEETLKIGDLAEIFDPVAASWNNGDESPRGKRFTVESIGSGHVNGTIVDPFTNFKVGDWVTCNRGGVRKAADQTVKEGSIALADYPGIRSKIGKIIGVPEALAQGCLGIHSTDRWVCFQYQFVGYWRNDKLVERDGPIPRECGARDRFTKPWPVNHGKLWSRHETQLVIGAYASGRSVETIAEGQGRTPWSIVCRLARKRIITDAQKKAWKATGVIPTGEQITVNLAVKLSFEPGELKKFKSPEHLKNTLVNTLIDDGVTGVSGLIAADVVSFSADDGVKKYNG